MSASKKVQFHSEPNETTYAAIEAAENDTELYGPFDSVSALMEALDA